MAKPGKRGVIGTLRRLVDRLVYDPMAEPINCGRCYAWVPFASFDRHLAWHDSGAS